jgi:exopolysaccharide biosynthesis polyprenyl glycosylphosphotransferase
MQTVWRTKEAIGQHTRRSQARIVGSSEAHAAISPVWETAPQGQVEFGPRPAVAQRDATLRRGLVGVDLLAAFAALAGVTGLIDPGRVHLRLAAVFAVPFLLVVAKIIGLYDRDPHLLRKTTIDETPSILYLSVVYALGTWLAEALLLHGFLARPQVLGLVLGTFCLITLGRLLIRRITFAMTAPERCLVIGNRSDADRIAAKFDSSAVNATVIGRVCLQVHDDLDDECPTESIPALGEVSRLARIVAEHNVERAIIASRSEGQELTLDAIRLVKALGVKVSVLPRLLEVVGSASTVDEVNGMWLLGVRQSGLARSSELLKRSMDIAIAAATLILLGPLFLMLTVAIKLDCRGPVFFRQPRVGRHGKSFWMLKFRSMVPDAEARKGELRRLNEVHGGLFKIDRDPRITRVGRLLRTTSLDELPQLINVIRGNMSLVGPRPLVPDEDALITGWQRRRLAVKPGMTGLWQIFGSSRIPMQEMVKIDYIYGANWSLWLDLRILLRTIPYMLARRGQ